MHIKLMQHFANFADNTSYNRFTRTILVIICSHYWAREDQRPFTSDEMVKRACANQRPPPPTRSRNMERFWHSCSHCI